jgi:hypothetical protein
MDCGTAARKNKSEQREFEVHRDVHPKGAWGTLKHV